MDSEQNYYQISNSCQISVADPEADFGDAKKHEVYATSFYEQVVQGLDPPLGKIASKNI